MLAFLFSSGGFGTCAMGLQAVPLHSTYGVFVKLLHPFAPHIAEEMWSILGHNESLTNVAWPEADHSKAVENTVEVVFQVNGKVRAKASVAKDMDKAALEKLALENERVKEFTKGMQVVKSIVVPGKLVNIVVK